MSIRLFKPCFDVEALPDRELVDQALFSEGFKAAVGRALSKRQDFGQIAGRRPSADEVGAFEATDFAMRINGCEARVVIIRGDRTGLLRRRQLTYWVFVAEQQGGRLFPVCRHDSIDRAAAMLTLLCSELSEPVERTA